MDEILGCCAIILSITLRLVLLVNQVVRAFNFRINHLRSIYFATIVNRATIYLTSLFGGQEIDSLSDRIAGFIC